MLEVKNEQVRMEGHWDELMLEWSAVTKGLYEMTAKQVGTGKANEIFVHLLVSVSASVKDETEEDNNE